MTEEVPNSFNIYCDESCHLEHDHQRAMVLGAVWCPREKAKAIADRIRGIKTLHGLSSRFEVKWSKVSPKKLRLYLGLVNYFFSEESLHFRALIVPDKSILDHDRFGHDHDAWYYKMYFDMLKILFSPDAKYRIFIDLKDTRGAAKVRKLDEVLRNNMYDFDRNILELVQLVKSHEVEQVQLADLLIGCVSSVNRGTTTSQAKQSLVQRFRSQCRYDLTKTTLFREQKVNLLRWEPGE